MSRSSCGNSQRRDSTRKRCAAGCRIENDQETGYRYYGRRQRDAYFAFAGNGGRRTVAKFEFVPLIELKTRLPAKLMPLVEEYREKLEKLNADHGGRLVLEKGDDPKDLRKALKAAAGSLNRRIRFRLLFRMGVLLPLVTSVVAVAVVFSQLYGRDFGMVNWLLGLVGVDPVFWQGEKWSSWIAISSMVDWRWTGYNAIIYLAAMQAIPRDLYEAAAIDGASAWRQFWKITVPLLRPTIIFTAFISTIGGLTLFAEPVMFGGGRVAGGTLGQFQTVTMFIVDKAFRDFEYGFAAAAAWLLFLLILLGSMINFFFVSRIRGTR